MATLSHERIVVGGGPAGCGAAIALASAGHKVLVLEKHTVASDKLCGEFISWEAAHYLQGLGIDLPGIGAELVEEVRLYDGESMIETPLPLPGWGISRRVLDEALLKRAEACGATVRRGIEVNELTRVGQRWLLKTAGNSLRARTVFLACGRQDARHLPRLADDHASSIGFKMHLRLVPRQSVALQRSAELFLFDGGYAMLEPVENGKVNLCIFLNHAAYQESGGSWISLLGWLSRSAPTLKLRIASAQPLWPRPLEVPHLSSGYLHRPFTDMPQLFQLGDQVAVVPSFAADGVAVALHSAVLAARTHLTGKDANEYYRRAWTHFRRPLRAARIVADLMATAEGRNAAFMLAQLLPGLMILTHQHVRLAAGDILSFGPGTAASLARDGSRQLDAVKH